MPIKTGKYKRESVILSRVVYAEADLIVHFLTPEDGKLSGLAKHGRKSRKRFGNLLLPGTLSWLDFKVDSGRELVRLESGELIRSLENVGRDPRLLGLVGLCLETVEAFCAPNDPAPDVFRLLTWSLDRLDRNLRPDEAVFTFQLKLLSLVGFGPNLTACAVCGRAVGEGFAGALFPELGGVTCKTCRPGGYAVCPGTLKLMALIVGLDLEKLERVRVGAQAVGEAGPFLLACLRHHLGRELKSVRYLEQLARPG